MKATLVFIKILFLLGLVHLSLQYICEKCGEVSGNDNGVNQGASTSTQEQLHRCQRCEIENYVNRLVFLMLSEDKNGDEDLVYMLNYRYTEMESFYDYVNSYIRLARFGDNVFGNDLTDERNRNLRQEQFNTLIEQFILQISNKYCTNHYHYHLYYEYSRELRELLIYQRQGPEAGSCLCSDADHCIRERSMTIYPLKIPELRYPQPERVLLNNGRDSSGVEDLTLQGITVYQIIPLATISRFFQTWLGSANLNDEFTQTYILGQNIFNGCMATLLLRLKRSIHKIILVSIKKSLIYDDFPKTSELESIIRGRYRDNYHIKEIESSFSWLGGNVYIGPTNRGPFHAAARVSPEEAFDTEIEPIIGQRRYVQLSRLYDSLMNFNILAFSMLPFQRLVEGFKIYAEMTLAFTMHSITPLNWRDWEYRRLTNEEILNNPRLRRLKQMKYYTTKKLDKKRDPRSVLLKEMEASVSEEQLVKNYWSDFVTDVMRVSVEAQSRNKTLPWKCQIAQLYDDFLAPRIDPLNYDCGNCPDFSQYLHKEILANNQWGRCLYADNDVCSAWRNITEILNNREDFRDSEYRRVGVAKWGPYLNYMETVVNWLSSPVEIMDKKEVKKHEYHLIQMPPHPAHKITFIETSLCFLSTIVPSVLLMKSDCKKMQNYY